MPENRAFAERSDLLNSYRYGRGSFRRARATGPCTRTMRRWSGWTWPRNGPNERLHQDESYGTPSSLMMYTCGPQLPAQMRPLGCVVMFASGTGYQATASPVDADSMMV